MKAFLWRAGDVVGRLRFTLLMLGVLLLVALFTNTYVADLSRHWLNRLGFAPRDLAAFRWRRLLTSALVTDGGWVFWEACALVTVGVGAAEWLTGTIRAAATFWGMHFLTLVVESFLIAVPLHLLGFSLSTALVVARDVGPSAGYFACFGLVSARLRRPWFWLSGAVGWAALVLVLFLPVQPGQDATISLSAGLAHCLAFLFGWLSSWLGAGRGDDRERQHGVWAL